MINIKEAEVDQKIGLQIKIKHQESIAQTVKTTLVIIMKIKVNVLIKINTVIKGNRVEPNQVIAQMKNHQRDIERAVKILKRILMKKLWKN